jgi:hypothetical protein
MIIGKAAVLVQLSVVVDAPLNVILGRLCEAFDVCTYIPPLRILMH